jgi:hypothetical protein
MQPNRIVGKLSEEVILLSNIKRGEVKLDETLFVTDANLHLQPIFIGLYLNFTFS